MEREAAEYSAYLAFDWSHKSHRYSLCGADMDKARTGDLENTPEAMREWFLQLRKEYPEGKIAVILEQARGPLIYFLLTLDYLLVFCVNPKAVAKYREAFQVSGCKNDPTDADLMLDLLYKHHQQLRPLQVEAESVRKLQLLVEARRSLVKERTKLIQKLTEPLKAYYPQALDLAGELSTMQACDFLIRWPSLQLLKRAKSRQIQSFYYKHGCRRKVTERIRQIAESQVVTSDSAIVASYVQLVKGFCRAIRGLILSIKGIDKEIRQAYARFPDRNLYESLPGAGEVLEPRLAAFFGTDRNRFNSPEEVQNCCGISPVTKESGSTKIVHQRYACSKFDKQTFHEFAGCSISWSKWARAQYEYLRKEKGMAHHAAVRIVAFKWIRILFRCWKDAVPFKEEIYLASLRKRNSPILKYMHPSKPEQQQIIKNFLQTVKTF